jgi:hypothetical protein
MTSRCLPLLVSCVATFAVPAPVRAAGVVGTGSPESCTEAALTIALAGGGIVTFDCGSQSHSIPLTHEHVISQSTDIDGRRLVHLSGQNANRHFRVPDAAPGVALTLRGLELANGRCPLAPPGAEPGFGGSIVAGVGASITLIDTFVSSNTCDPVVPEAGGGAIHVRGGALSTLRVMAIGNRGSDGCIVNTHDSSVTIEDSTFTSSTCTGRGGVVFAKGSAGGRIVLRRARILSMSAPGGGGAVYGSFEPGDQGLLVEDTLITSSNTLSADGGALHVQGGSVTIDGSTFSANGARRGGAVFLQNGALAVSNATFTGNRAREGSPGDGNGMGAAFFLAEAHSGVITHATFVGNLAEAAGGAFASAGSSPLVLRASILAGNAAGTGPDLSPTCSMPLASGGFNIQSPGADPDCVPGVLRDDPGVGPFEFTTVGYFPLWPESRATDFVTSGCPPPAVDQRGVTRPKGVGCDAGSYEWAPLITVEHAERYEGNTGAAPMTFTVRLSAPAVETVTVAYSTGPEGVATPGVDYLSAAGVMTFPPGVVERTVDVSILGDAIQERSEPFTFRLSAPTGGVLGTGATYGTIIDDDWPPTISVVGCDADESDPSCRFRVHLNLLNGAPVTVQYATASGSATAGEDFQAVSGTLTFPPGSFEAFVDVPILQDTLDEPTEVYTFQLSAPQNGTIGVGTASGGILDDDGPFVSIGDVSTFEGDSGQHIVNLTVTLSAPSPEPVTIGYGTHQGTALANLDYLAIGSQIIIPAGQLTGTVAAVILGDTLDEPDERFRVVLTAQGATVLGAGGMVTIRDDDGGVIRVSELTSGAVRTADLTNGDDLYIVSQPAYSSWEVVVDEASGDVGPGTGPGLERMAADLSTVIQFSSPVGAGPARTLRWANVEFGGTQDEYVRVSSHGCDTDCGTDDVYRVRVYETTLRGPRFNCGAGQSTVLLLQNIGDEGVGAWVSPWRHTGAPFPTAPVEVDVPAHGMQVSNVCAYPGLAGGSGSITIAHTGAYGQVVGKLVAADPATGASFDTPLTARPR